MAKAFSVFIFIFSIALITSCEKKDAEGRVSTLQNDVLSNNAMLKVNNATIFKSNPYYKIRINDSIVSDAFLARTPYPGGGYNTNGNSLGNYLAVPEGNVKFSLVIPYRANATQQDTLKWKTDSITVFSTTLTLNKGMYYTLHITDTNNIKHLLVEDKRTLPTDTLPYYKFVNLMPNVPALDLYFGPVKVASNISYLTASPEFTVDITQASQAWTLRKAGDTSTAAATAVATYTSSGTITRGRKYTAFAMGYSGLTGTTELRRPFISFYLNR